MARVLIGRAREIERIEGHLDSAAAGAGTAVALTGPAGIGKTCLVDDMASRARARGMSVHWGAAWDGPGAPSLWPWIQIVRSLGAEMPRAETRFELLDAVVQLVQDAAGRSPAVVVLEDFHAADEVSSHLLDLLVRQRRGHALCVVVTYRPGELTSTLARATRESDVIALGGLDRDAVVDLVAAEAPRLDAALAEHLAEATGGNPFFVLELARAIEIDGAHNALPLPPTVLDVIDRHLRLVDDGVRDVLAAAAVQGTAFDASVVAGATARSLAEVVAGLRRAAQVGIVGSTPPHDRFAHALMVEAVLRSVPSTERQRLHLAVGRQVDDPEIAAIHLAEAGDRCPARELIDRAQQAAEVARSRFAHLEAARHLGAAITVARRLDDPGFVADLLVERCEARKAARELHAARRDALDAASISRSIGDDRRLALAALVIPPDAEGIEVDQLADPDQIALREEALAHLPRDDDALAARLMAGLAMSLYWVARTGDRALDHQATAVRRDQLTATALDTARRSRDDTAVAYCLNARLAALWGPDAAPGRSELVAELDEVARRVGDGEFRLQSLTWTVVDAMLLGAHERLRAAVSEYTRLAEARRDPTARWTSLRWQSAIALIEGRLDDAETLAERARQLGVEAIDADAAVLFWAVPVGFAQFMRGTLGDAFEFVRAQAEDPDNVPAWRAGYVLTATEAGEHDLAAAELLALAVDRFAALPRDLDWRSSLVALAPAVEVLGDGETAKVLIDLLEPFDAEHAIVGLGYTDYGPVRRAIALARVATGDREGAVADLRRCLADLHPAQAGLRALCQRDLDRLLGGMRPNAVLCRSGDRWEVGRPETGALHSLRPLRGFALLHELVRRETDLTALELLWAVEPPDEDDEDVRRALATGRGEPVLDDRARADYRRRIRVLTEELDAADLAGSPERSAAAARELELLRTELARATGLGGRNRRATDATERARTSVTKRLRRAIAAVTEVDAVLGAHLDRSISTGNVCRYRPAEDDRYDWTLEGRVGSS